MLTNRMKQVAAAVTLALMCCGCASASKPEAPKTESAASQSEAAVSTSESAASEVESAASEAESTASVSESTAPKAESTAPESESTAPESESTAPESESAAEAESVAAAPEAGFKYEHDPRDNPAAMKDIIVNPDAVYGFSPNPDSERLGEFADFDWTDPEAVAGARAERAAYLESFSELYRMIEEMLGEAKPVEEIARAVSKRRNELRLESYKDDPEGLEAAKKSNLETYGHEDGPQADELYEKYGSWQTVLEKALSSNPGMDACLGFYDDNYYTYDIEAAEEALQAEKAGSAKSSESTGSDAADAAAAPQETAAEEAEGNGAVDELMIRLNRSELEGLGKVEGPVYVFGHQAPDADTVCSSIGYAYILRELGYDAQPVLLGQINHETAYILKTAGVEIPPVLEDASGENVVLVDHSDNSQSAEGLESARVLMIIDHHGVGTVQVGSPLVYDARPIGSTATIVWIRSVNYGVELDQQMCLVLLGAILSDTSGLRSETTTEADREVARILSEKAGVADTEAFFREIYKASLSYEGMTDQEILLSDLKKYEAEGTSYVIGVVNCYEREELPGLADRMKAVLPEVVTLKGAEFGFAQISVFHDDISVNYIVPSDDRAAEVLSTAFGEQGVWEGSYYVLEPGVSRKKVLVPAVNDALSLHPKE